MELGVGGQQKNRLLREMCDTAVSPFSLKSTKSGVPYHINGSQKSGVPYHISGSKKSGVPYQQVGAKKVETEVQGVLEGDE